MRSKEKRMIKKVEKPWKFEEFLCFHGGNIAQVMPTGNIFICLFNLIPPEIKLPHLT